MTTTSSLANLTTPKNFAFVKTLNAERHLDWSKIRYFKPTEFPAEELCLLNKHVVEELDTLRSVLGIPIHVSPAPGAVVRHNEHAQRQRRSYHFFDADTGKLGQAIDVFLDTLTPFPSPIHIINHTFAFTRFRGLGLYFDTTLNGVPKLMLHLDLRHSPTIWFVRRVSLNIEQPGRKGSRREYVYPKTTRNWMEQLETHFEKFKEKVRSKLTKEERFQEEQKFAYLAKLEETHENLYE